MVQVKSVIAGHCTVSCFDVFAPFYSTISTENSCEETPFRSPGSRAVASVVGVTADKYFISCDFPYNEIVRYHC